MDIKKYKKSSKKYICEVCQYNTGTLYNYNKHLLTLKHKNATNADTLDINGTEKVSTNVVHTCNCCNYITNIKSNYEKHLTTEKHKKQYIIANQGEPNEIKYRCNECNKEYMNYGGLWKHKKKCRLINDNGEYEEEPLQNNTIQNNNIATELFLEVLKESKELQNVLIEQNKDLQNKLAEQQNIVIEQQNIVIEQNKHIIELAKNQSVVNNNTNNNQFNLQLYLNETCKDAMNIVDFVNSLQLTTDDFETTGKLGFVDGISRIFIKELKKIDTEKLPIHCTDFKRETVYIKDNNTWEKENDEKKKLKWTIDRIAKLNYNQIQQWQEKFPECRENNTPANEHFFRLVKTALGGYGKEEEDKFRDKIMRNVLKEVVLDRKQRTIHST
jgi:hypothetical protein